MITREQIQAFLASMESQEQHFDAQLTMTVGAIQALKHLLSLEAEEIEESETHGD